MTSIVDSAIAYIQDLVLSSSDTIIKNAPDLPVDDASILPLAITHITGGTGTSEDASGAKLLLNVAVDVHFDRQSIKRTYQLINAFIPEFLRRLAGDPGLGGTVSAIVFPVTVTVEPADWGSIVTHMVRFNLVLKFRETPLP